MNIDIDENITREEAIKTLKEAYDRAIKAQHNRDENWRLLTMLTQSMCEYPGERCDEAMLNYYSFDKFKEGLS
jgi:hypothetical protein